MDWCSACQPVFCQIRIYILLCIYSFDFFFQIRQIVGKQSRLNVKTVRNNQQLQLDNSSASNNITMDSSENPFQGRAIARSEKDIKESDTKENTAQDLNSTFEKPKTPEKNMIPSKDLIPRTPLKEDVEKSGDDVKGTYAWELGIKTASSVIFRWKCINYL